MADHRIVIGVAVAMALAGACFGIGWKTALKLHPAGVKVDSVVVYRTDTITREKPVYLTKYVDRIQLVQVRDTLRLHDTLFVALERERIEWRDEYAAVYASGIEPSVDSVRHFIREKVVTQTIQVPGPQRWKRVGWAVTAGPGVFWQPGMDNVAPGLGVVVGLRINIGK